jgi:hypothetical protein
MRYQSGGDGRKGKEEIRSMLERKRRGEQMFAIAAAARWTLNALAGCYAYGLDRRGLVQEPVDGPYKCLMAGLEAFAGTVSGLRESVPGGERRYATDSSGRKYATILASGIKEGDTEMRYEKG